MGRVAWDERAVREDSGSSPGKTDLVLGGARRATKTQKKGKIS